MGQRRVASPVTATTDFLAPDILNKCGRAVPPRRVTLSVVPWRPMRGSNPLPSPIASVTRSVSRFFGAKTQMIGEQ